MRQHNGAESRLKGPTTYDSPQKYIESSNNVKIMDKCLHELNFGKASGAVNLTFEHLIHPHPYFVVLSCGLFCSWMTQVTWSLYVVEITLYLMRFCTLTQCSDLRMVRTEDLGVLQVHMLHMSHKLRIMNNATPEIEVILTHDLICQPNFNAV